MASVGGGEALGEGLQSSGGAKPDRALPARFHIQIHTYLFHMLDRPRIFPALLPTLTISPLVSVTE